jgi:hypothetical protein
LICREQYVLLLFVIIQPPPAALDGTMQSAPAQDAPGGHGAQDGERDQHAAMLQELAEIGMDMARMLRQKMRDCGPEPEQAVGLMRAFSHVARSVRLTLALKERFAAERTARAKPAAIKPIGSPDEPWGHARGGPQGFAERQRHRRRKSQVRSVVEQLIKAGAERREAEDLFVDLRERLKDPELDEELGDGPIGRIIRGICDDLGIKFDYGLVDDEALKAIIADHEAFFPETGREADETTEGASVSAAEPRGPP